MKSVDTTMENMNKLKDFIKSVGHVEAQGIDMSEKKDALNETLLRLAVSVLFSAVETIGELETRLSTLEDHVYPKDNDYE